MVTAQLRRTGPLALGVLVLLLLWVTGGRAGWGSGMVVTPSEALEPIFGDSRDVYTRATVATVWAAGRGLVVGALLAALVIVVVSVVVFSIAGWCEQTVHRRWS